MTDTSPVISYTASDAPVDVIARMRNKVWNTRNARFVASRRLSAISRAASFSLSVSSLMVAVVPFAPTLLPDGTLSPAAIAALCFLAGLIIFSLGLLDASSQREVRGERLYVCAVNLNKLYDESHTWGDHQEECARRLCNEYHRIIGECAANHDTVDDAFARASGVLKTFSTNLLSSFTSRAAFVAFCEMLRTEVSIAWRWRFAPLLPYYLLSLAIPLFLLVWVRS